MELKSIIQLCHSNLLIPRLFFSNYNFNKLTEEPRKFHSRTNQDARGRQLVGVFGLLLIVTNRSSDVASVLLIKFWAWPLKSTKIKRVLKIRHRWTDQLVLVCGRDSLSSDKHIELLGQFYQVWSVQSGEISKICLNLIFVKGVFCLNPLKRWSPEIQFSTFQNFCQISPPFFYSGIFESEISTRCTRYSVVIGQCLSSSADSGSRITDTGNFPT